MAIWYKSLHDLPDMADLSGAQQPHEDFSFLICCKRREFVA